MLHASRSIPAAVAVCSLLVAGAASAQAAKLMKEGKPLQFAQARVTPEAARTTALRGVKESVMRDEGIEREHGEHAYSFDMRVTEESPRALVLVDATTGAIVSVEHETLAHEKAEAANDAEGAKAKQAHKRPAAGPVR